MENRIEMRICGRCGLNYRYQILYPDMLRGPKPFHISELVPGVAYVPYDEECTFIYCPRCNYPELPAGGNERERGANVVNDLEDTGWLN